MNDAASVVRLVDGSRHVLTDARATIGGGDSESICLPVASVSRLHAAIDRTPHGYLLRDLQSRNGVFVNGQRVGAGGHALRDGDEIVIGGAECLRFVDPLGTPIGPGIGRLHGVWIDPDSRTVWVD